MKRVFALLLSLTFGLTLFAIVISDVKFVGLVTVSEKELMPLVKDYIGVELKDEAIAEIAKKVFDVGYFSSLEPKLVASEGRFILQFVVQENPIVRDWKLNLEGPELVKLTDVASVVTLEKGKALNMSKVRESLNAIKQKFDEAGYFLVEISGDFKDNTYFFNVVPYALWDIYFVGEIEGLDIAQVRRQIKIDTMKDYYTTPSLLRILIKDIKRCYPTVNDISAVLSTLANYVYFGPETSIDFEKIEIPNVSEKAVAMKVKVVQPKYVPDEGKVYEKIEFSGNELINSEQLRKVVSVGEYRLVRNSDVLRSMQAILDLYKEKGYPLCYVVVQDQDKTLQFRIIEKYVANVEFKGFERTRTYVVDDLVTFKPGQPLRQKDFYDTISALNRTQFFEAVKVYPVAKPENRDVDVVVEVKEKDKKFSLSGGISWSPVKDRPWYEGFFGEVSFSTINPFGYGQTFATTLKLGFESKLIQFDYSIRKPFKLPATLGALFSYEWTNSTQILKVGGNASTLRFAGHAFGGGVTYENRSYIDFSENTLILSGNYSYDTRSDPIFPTQGRYLYFGLDKAGLFNLADRDYWKFRLDVRMFMPVWNEQLVAAFRFFTSAVLFDKYTNPGSTEETILFYGIDSVRGVDATKAKAGILASGELRYDLKSQTLPMYVLAFVDAGGTGETLAQPTLKLTAGPELDVVVPMLGVMGFGVAYDFNGQWTWENFKPFFRFGAAF
ncbi:BamA/OMP85 family outer membrane protein [Thermotoga caldifontis]|uniref:BamA/OMP85 family outer membrane protein n=1 Tax=Thermotoga caldifontis TaxID=1508419 RepID=UPI000596C487|nr:POTRA domain-containing protein [Thermotoga caldifontis]